MPILKSKTGSGWQVVDNDGKPMSRDTLTYKEAQKKEAELSEDKPLELWVRERGLLKKKP